jgi:hypothetical protein
MATRRFGAIGTGLLDNLEATDPPTAANDVGEGYKVGSMWIDTTPGIVYICVDETENTAVWIVSGDQGVTASAADWSGISNESELRVLDAHVTTIDIFADVLGTLIEDLRVTGILA